MHSIVGKQAGASGDIGVHCAVRSICNGSDFDRKYSLAIDCVLEAILCFV